jgi:glycerophosphoryl diester phosphodiesterase
MSFSYLALRRVHRVAPALPLVYLMERVPPWFRDGSLPRGARVAGPSIATVRSRPDYVRRVQAAGHEVHVWTVDDPDDVALCQDLGVDTIITNRPRDVLKLLDSS